jgi:hypothetical protein
MDAVRAERLLSLLLRVTGTMMLLAVLAVLMPRSCMARTHELLGLGPFPDGAIVDYLARSLSGFYAIHGGLFWLLSRDIRRYAPIIRFCGWTGLVGGAGLLALDWHLGLPTHWILGEGPFVVLLCAAILYLVRRCGDATTKA